MRRTRLPGGSGVVQPHRALLRRLTARMPTPTLRWHFSIQGLIMNIAFAKSATELAQAPRADYAAPTLSLLFVQSTEAGLGKLNDGVSLKTSNILD